MQHPNRFPIPEKSRKFLPETHLEFCLLLLSKPMILENSFWWLWIYYRSYFKVLSFQRKKKISTQTLDPDISIQLNMSRLDNDIINRYLGGWGGIGGRSSVDMIVDDSTCHYCYVVVTFRVTNFWNDSQL